MSDSESSTDAGTATILLPPGMTADEFFYFQGSLVTLAINFAVVFGIIAWDYLSLLPEEYKFYRSSKKAHWRTAGPYAFVVLRYSGILATLPALFFTSVQSDYCQVATSLSEAGVVLVMASSGTIFCLRVIAIWGNNRPIILIVTFMLLVTVGCWIALASQFRATTGPPTPFASNCLVKTIVPWSALPNAASVAFDTLILILTIYKLGAQKSRSRIAFLMYRDNLLYFLATAVTNITVLVIQTLNSSSPLVNFFLKPNVLPYSTLMTVAMGTRVFLNLTLSNARQKEAQQSLPHSVKLTPLTGTYTSERGNFLTSVTKDGNTKVGTAGVRQW